MNAMLRVCFIAALAAACSLSLKADEYDDLRTKWRGMLTGIPYNSSDPDIMLRLDEIEAEAQGYWSTMDTTPGTYLWSDEASSSDYSHLTATYNRLRVMAVAYVSPGQALYNNATLLSDIITGLDWMYANRYNETMSVVFNWYHWEIGVPSALHDICTLLYTQLGPTRITNFTNATAHFNPTVSGTATNRLSDARVVAIRGILRKSSTDIANARDGMDQVFPYVTVGDGFYADGSFVFHTKHPYTGGYGHSLFTNLHQLIGLLRGSTWQVTTASHVNAYEWFYDSFEPVFFRGQMMDFVRGRELSRIGTPKHGRGLPTNALIAAEASPTHAGYFRSAAKAWLLSDTTFTSPYDGLTSIYAIKLAKTVMNDANIAPRSLLLRFFPFHAMDRAVHHRPGWAAALAMHSTRIFNYESIGSENKRGYHQSDGMLYLYDSDLNQFSDHFWPTIDSQRLPGTTVIAGSQPPGGNAGTKSFVGSSWSYDKFYGAATMDVGPYNSSLVGKRSWFFFDDEIVALGAGLSAGSGTIETIVENRKLTPAGTNAFSINGAAPSGFPTTPQVSPATVSTFSNVGRAHFAGNVSGSDTGYYFPGGTTLKAVRETRTGSWSQINSSPLHNDTTTRTNHFLTLWFDHGTSGSYSYAILPNTSSSATNSYATNPEIVVLGNTTTAQAVKETTMNTIGAVFHSTGTVGSGTDEVTMSGTSGCGIVMVQTLPGEIAISVSDPSQPSSRYPIVSLPGRVATSVILKDSSITNVQLNPVRFQIATGNKKGVPQKIRFATAHTPVTVFSDNFNDGNSTGWTTAGGSWSMVMDGTWRYRQTSTTGLSGSMAAGTWANFTASVKVKMTAGASGATGPALMFRARDIQNGYMLQLCQPEGELRLYRVVNGPAELLGSVPFTAALNTTYELKVKASGSTLTCYVDNVALLTVTDGYYTTGGVGFRLWKTAFSADDVLVTE